MGFVNLPIHQVSNIKGIKKAHLSLEGSILIYLAMDVATEYFLHIPIELISISEKKRFRGDRLIKAFLSLLIPMLTLGMLYGLLFEGLGIDHYSIYGDILTIVMFVLLPIGFIIFWFFLIKFFIKQKTVCLAIAPDEIIIEFWKDKRFIKQTDELIAQIKERQADIEEAIEGPAEQIIGFIDQHSALPKLAALTLLLCLPFLITKKQFLLILPLVPIGYYLYVELQYRRQPKEFRRAMKSYLRKEWQNAIANLEVLKARLPTYLPAYTFLADIYTRIHQFDKALEVTSQIPNEYLDTSHDIQTRIWKFRRIHERCEEYE